MPRSSSRKFQGLLTDAPKPLPDDEEPESAELPGAEGPVPAAAAPEPVSVPGTAAAAAALNSAWLDQRMHVNPKLSYPEFASEIVRLGLAAFKRQAERS